MPDWHPLFLGDDPAADHFLAVVPDGKLTGGDSPLGSVEEDEKTVLAAEERRTLEGLAVADADAVAAHVADRHREVLADPVDFGRVDAQAEAAQALVVMAFAHIDDVGLGVRVDDEDRLRMAAHAESLALADRIELRAFVFSGDNAIGIRLDAGLLDMLLAAAVGLGLEVDFIVQRRGETGEFPVRERCDFRFIERAVSQRLTIGCQHLLFRCVTDGTLQRNALPEQAVQHRLLPLIQGVIGIPGIEDFHDVAFDGGELLLEECRKVHLPHETDALGVLLLGRREVGFLRQPAHFRLDEVPDGEEGLSELGLGQLAQEIGLVLVGVGSLQDAAGAVGEDFLPAVVAGGHIVGPVLLGDTEESVELDLAVAQYVRVRSAALGVLVEHVIDNALAVFLGEVHEIERNADLACDEFGHEAVLLPFAVPVEGGIGLVPVLHEHGEDVVALLLQEEGRHGGIHAAGKADADFDFGVIGAGRCHFVRFSPAKVMI